jgi:hypothetical protein
MGMNEKITLEVVTRHHNGRNYNPLFHAAKPGSSLMKKIVHTFL